MAAMSSFGLAPTPSPAARELPKPSTEPLLRLPDLPTPMKEKILCLEMMGIDSGRALSLNPKLRSTPIDSLNSVVSYLISKGIHYKDLGRIFGMCPAALTADVRRDLAPVFRFLAAELSVPSDSFRRVVNKCPRVLVCSVHDQLLPALTFLRRLGFKDMEALAYQDTILLVSSVERTLLPKLEFLAMEVGGREAAEEMVRRCPGLFTFSVENNFRPKLGFLKGGMGREVGEVREFPQYFAFSLEKRIKPRWRVMREKGVELSLAEMLKSTDQEFRELVGR